eukprot:802265-Prorocentrum_minimum.AAC.1
MPRRQIERLLVRHLQQPPQRARGRSPPECRTIGVRAENQRRPHFRRHARGARPVRLQREALRGAAAAREGVDGTRGAQYALRSVGGGEGPGGTGAAGGAPLLGGDPAGEANAAPPRGGVVREGVGGAGVASLRAVHRRRRARLRMKTRENGTDESRRCVRRAAGRGTGGPRRPPRALRRAQPRGDPRARAASSRSHLAPLPGARTSSAPGRRGTQTQSPA